MTDVACRKAKAVEKPVKMADSHGLFLYVTPAGLKSWRMKYRYGGKEKLLTFGKYPQIPLTEARRLRDEAQSTLRDGRDPSIEKKQRKAERATRTSNTFEEWAGRWHASAKKHWTPRYAGQVLGRLERDAYPAIGQVPIADVTVPMVLDLLQRVEARGAIEGAHRLRQHMSDIFLSAIAAGVAQMDPATGVKRALQRFTHNRRPAARSIVEGRQVLQTIEQQEAHWSTLLASRLLALTAARPGVVRLAEEKEFEDLDGASPIWRIPAAKMKLTSERKRDVTFEFVVPLSPAAVAVVRTAIRISGNGVLFPGMRTPKTPISDSTISKLYRAAGFTGIHVPHGWRSTFSTIMNEIAAIENRVGDRDIIDLMLAHLPGDVESVYNRYAYLPRRRELALEWSAMLMEGAVPADELVREPARRSFGGISRERRPDRPPRRQPR
ncbi:integrase arm-type DNA-binding domain-containing protein [uncultured Sphingomonas sp.]|uniref:tyrosine-type recombinase/integrase n=1 Tax=uncultured Sphingomonas sp. TaxID=158754 RepID=UPI0025CF90DD|nr:integrase arm-type DNA-binding domain-containing protein [uncultured Sphingomonas sp.]